MEYLEMPLDVRRIIENLNRKQKGSLLQAILEYAFEGIEPDFSNDHVLTKAFILSIRQCRKGIEINEVITKTTRQVTETFEDYGKDIEDYGTNG